MKLESKGHGFGKNRDIENYLSGPIKPTKRCKWSKRALTFVNITSINASKYLFYNLVIQKE